MAPHAMTLHAQDASVGRVQEVVDGIVQAARGAGPWERLDAAVAYASAGGVRLLCDRLRQQPSWATSSKRFLVSMDFGTTQPAAFEMLAREPNLEVRVPNASDVLAQARLMPPTTFHAKGYLFDSEIAGGSTSLIVGSANLTVSALATGSELMASHIWTGRLSASEYGLLREADRFRSWFEDAWALAEPAAPLLAQYAALRRRWRIGPPPEDRTRTVQRYDADPDATEVAGTVAVQLTTAKSIWFRTDTLYVNLQSRGVGNQLDTPRGTRVFFGFPPAQVPKNHVFGPVEIQIPGHAAVERSVRFGNNMMDKVNLPVPGVNGPANYDNSVLIFDRAGIGPKGLPLFRLTVTNMRGLAARKRVAANHVDLAMHGGRPYGLLF